MRVVLFGAPGSGKGTQGAILAERLQVPLLSTGDLLRRRAPNDSELSTYLDRGEFVPDDLVLEVIGDALRSAVNSGGYVLDGFPRTRVQAQHLESLAPPDVAVYLDLPDDVARRRVMHRALTGRADDAGQEAIQRRLDLFHTETEPLLDFYRDRGLVTAVDADQSPEAVRAAIARALEATPRL
jgi:adenylate kinase